MSLEQAVSSFRSKVESSYELDTEFVDALCEYFKEAAASACPSGGAPAEAKASKPRARKSKAASAPASPVEAATPVASEVAETAAAPSAAVAVEKQKRKKSAYNVYVRDMMQHADISSLNHKEKMVAIAARWKGMTDEGRAEYATKAASESE